MRLRCKKRGSEKRNTGRKGFYNRSELITHAAKETALRSGEKMLLVLRSELNFVQNCTLNLISSPEADVIISGCRQLTPTAVVRRNIETPSRRREHEATQHARCIIIKEMHSTCKKAGWRCIRALYAICKVRAKEEEIQSSPARSVEARN